MRIPWIRLFAFLIAAFAASFALTPVPGVRASADAPPCSTSALWGFQTAQQFLPRAVSARPFGIDVTVVSAGTVIYGLWGETTSGGGGHTGGTVRWSVPAPLGITYEDDPVVAALSFGHGTVVLSTTSEGRVICLDAATGTIRWLSPRVRRATCGDDTVEGGPAIQLWARSNAAFRAAIPDDDLVFVPTSYRCGTSTENRVYAFNASNGTTRWVFNDPPAVDMDLATVGCAVDEATNRVYCGTHLPAANPGQHTAWALDSRNGALVWSKPLATISSRPQVGGAGHVYFGEEGGTLRALDLATGNPGWSRDLSPSTADDILRTVWPEFRPPFGNRVYATTGDGALHALLDGGGAVVTELWTPAPNAGYVAAPAVNAATGKLYVGRLDGRVEEFNLGSGLPETSVLVKAGAPVTSVALDSAGTASAPDRLMTAAGGLMRRHCIPWTVTVDVDDPGPDGARGGAGALAMTGAAPNPFRVGASLSYRLTEAGRVTITIYDARGARVRLLPGGATDAGEHRAAWDGTDDAGRAVASGLYYVRVEFTNGRGETVRAERPLLRLR